MKDKKLQVFVSSTYSDLREERQAAVEAILSSGNIPAGMELFAAGDETQMTVIKRWIDESDVYLLILGGRYGSIEQKSGKSYTHLEYEYALQQHKPLFAVVVSEDALKKKVKKIGAEVIETDNPSKLKEFRAEVLSNLVRFWEDRKDIKIAIHETMSEFSFRKDLIGWIRGDNLINSGFLAEEIARLTKENSELRTAIINNDGKDNALYANLRYDEMEELLKRENAGRVSLFDFLMANGDAFSRGIHYTDRNAVLDKLVLRRLLTLERPIGGNWKYKFSADGNNFYLKALLKNPNPTVKQ